MQCNWCGKTYTNGYGGGYCSRRCYEEGHRRTCKGCGRSFTGSGYSGSGIIFNGGGDWCSEACYNKNASPAQRKADAATAKFIWTIVLLCIFPPLLFVLYWKQTLAVIKFVFKVIFSKFFWKYVVPFAAVVVAIVMYLAHRDKVKACEEEMSQYTIEANTQLQDEIGALVESRKAILAEEARRKAEEERRRVEEARQKQLEIETAKAAAKAEQRHQQESLDKESFARQQMQDTFQRVKSLKDQLMKIDPKIKGRRADLVKEGADAESDDEYASLVQKRNLLLRERRELDKKIEVEYRKWEKSAE